jgi:hypothetical protein
VIRHVLPDILTRIFPALAGADRDLALASALGDWAAVTGSELVGLTAVTRQTSALTRDIVAAYVAGHPAYADQCFGIYSDGIHVVNPSSL